MAGLYKEGPDNLGSGSWEHRVQGTRLQEFGVQGPGSWECRALCSSKLSIGTAGRQDLQARLAGDPCTTLQGKGILVQGEYREEEGGKFLPCW